MKMRLEKCAFRVEQEKKGKKNWQMNNRFNGHKREKKRKKLHRTKQLEKLLTGTACESKRRRRMKCKSALEWKERSVDVWSVN